MANTIAPAGFIVVGDDEEIWGIGPTRDAAWANLEFEMRMTGITLLEDAAEIPEDGGDYTRASNFKILPATAALIAEVERKGCAVAWDAVGGVCRVSGEVSGDAKG